MPAPTLLAGPMLRRVEARSVAVWIATNGDPGVLQLQVFRYGGAQVAGTASLEKVRLGDALWVGLFRLECSVDLTPGTLYGYKLFDGSTYVDLSTLCLKGMTSPTFMLPSAVGSTSGLRLVQGSCRKPHGGGQDALALLATVLDDTATDLANRPQLLVLTGDQIYADDVHVEVLSAIRKLAPILFKWTETLGEGSEPLLTPSNVEAKSFRYNFLQKIGFKSLSYAPSEYGYYQYHLLSFQEWCTMYLLCWSEWLWNAIEAGEVTDKKLKSFLGTLKNVRRALANIPSYMIFDDHDVTDDWFQQSHRALLEKGTGTNAKVSRRIIRNGMLAYMLFQDWGNQPTDYLTGTDWGKVIARLSSTGANVPELLAISPAPKDEDSLLKSLGILGNNDLNVAGLAPGVRRLWNYRYVGPDFDLVVLDTRTWRGNFLDSSNKNLGESLLTRQAIINQLPTPSTQRTLILLAPAPMGGFDIVEAAQKGKMTWEHLSSPLLSEDSATKLDYEGWAINPKALGFLISRLGKVRPVVLSGDVHYAYSQWVTLKEEWRETPTLPNRPPDLLQLCSSSSKNAEALTRALSLTDLFTSVGGDISVADLGQIAAAVTTNHPAIAASVGDFAWVKVQETGDRIGEIIADPAFELRKKIGDKASDFFVNNANIALRPLLLTQIAAQVLYGQDFLSAMAGAELYSAESPISGISLTDKRQELRYQQTSWDLLAKESQVPKGTKDWFDASNVTPSWGTVIGGTATGLVTGDTSVLRDAVRDVATDDSLLLKYLNFLSVGDPNIGIVHLKQGFGGVNVAHALLWTLPAEKADMPLYREKLPPASSSPAWAVTLHTTTL